LARAQCGAPHRQQRRRTGRRQTGRRRQNHRRSRRRTAHREIAKVTSAELSVVAERSHHGSHAETL